MTKIALFFKKNYVVLLNILLLFIILSVNYSVLYSVKAILLIIIYVQVIFNAISIYKIIKNKGLKYSKIYLNAFSAIAMVVAILLLYNEKAQKLFFIFIPIVLILLFLFNFIKKLLKVGR